MTYFQRGSIFSALEKQLIASRYESAKSPGRWWHGHREGALGWDSGALPPTSSLSPSVKRAAWSDQR